MILQGKPMEPGSGHREGRQLLAQMYLQAVGEPMPEILVTDRGKPYFANSPWHFSISHSKNHVFCALSDRPVGLDAEELDRKVDLRLAHRVLSESEKVRYEASDDKKAALLRLWVLKEAAAKLTGEGLKGFPNHTDFDPADPRIMEMNGCYVAIIENAE